MTFDINTYYPNWLRKEFINDSLPWASAIVTTMPNFFAEYTFHDSYWIGLWYTPYRVISIINWDTVWTKNRIPNSTAYLLIEFSKMYQIFHVMAQYEEFSTIAGGETKLITQQERESLFELAFRQTALPKANFDFSFEDTLHLTTIFDMNWSQINILHNPEVKILCLSYDGDLIPIPDL